MWMLGLVSCAGFRFGPPAKPVGAVPAAARPEDVARADEFFKQGGKGGFHPPAESTPALTPQNSAYVVELDQQRAYLFHGSDLIAVSKLSSGRRHYRTETGEYVIGQKKREHRSNLYGDYVMSQTGKLMLKDVTAGFDPVPEGGQFQGSLMRYFQRFERSGRKPTAMGFHAGVLPGYPASHGCVRLPATMARWFFEHVPQGTPVIVRGSKYGVPYGSNQSRPKRQPKVIPELKTEEPVPPPATPPPGAEGAAPPPDAPPPAAPAEAVAPAPAEPSIPQ
jgi:lipoprotein-anchoring transpeptidase ErfK/SrfK